MTKRNRHLLASVAVSTAVLAAPALQAQATLSIDVQQPKALVSNMLYGLMTEEINYSYYYWVIKDTRLLQDAGLD